MSRQLEGWFPRLALSGYAVTSAATPDYNCVAWAVRDTDRWWWPDPMDQYYWPEDAPREETLEAFVVAFARLGFTRCDTADYEPGHEKVALFADPVGKPTHAARQLEGGQWTSKIGAQEDISHVRLSGLQGSVYGHPVAFFRR